MTIAPLIRQILATWLVLLALPMASPAIPRFKRTKTETTSSIYDDYLKRVRAMNPALPATTGSLWVSSGPLATMSSDYKARNPGDLIVIHLTDTFTAATSGENKQSRQFSANSSITGLVGTIGAKNRLRDLFGANSAHSLDGKGQSTFSSNVTLNLAAQVMETLPNGTLVVQAARDITVGIDRQTVFIRGLIRPGDLAPDNSVPSSAVSDLQVEIKGKGAVADAARQPNIVIRTLLRLFSF
jgi:flagellar L-ring protein precursor FlgH